VADAPLRERKCGSMPTYSFDQSRSVIALTASIAILPWPCATGRSAIAVSFSSVIELRRHSPRGALEFGCD
jgi:hypothetical protein